MKNESEKVQENYCTCGLSEYLGFMTGTALVESLKEISEAGFRKACIVLKGSVLISSMFHLNYLRIAGNSNLWDILFLSLAWKVTVYRKWVYRITSHSCVSFIYIIKLMKAVPHQLETMVSII